VQLETTGGLTKWRVAVGSLTRELTEFKGGSEKSEVYRTNTICGSRVSRHSARRNSPLKDEVKRKKARVPAIIKTGKRHKHSVAVQEVKEEE